MELWCICTPGYKSLGTSIPRSGVIIVTLSRFGGSGPPCGRCSVGHLCLLKLVLNSGDEDPGLLMSAVASTQ